MRTLIILAIWFLLSVWAGNIAKEKGRSYRAFFLLAFLLSPLVGLIVASLIPENKEQKENQAISSGEGKLCPYCRELVKATAKVCKHCNRDLIEADIIS